MKVCIECGLPTENLYIAYSKQNIRMLRCKSCNKVCDKYQEFDVIIVVIDLVLLKKPAYRHILFNTTAPNIWRLGIVILLLDVYVRWFRIEKLYKRDPLIIYNPNVHSHQTSLLNEWLIKQYGEPNDILIPPLQVQYFYVLILCLFETIAWYFGIFLSFFLIKTSENTQSFKEITTSLILSSFGKFIPITTIIWTKNINTAYLEVENQLLVVFFFVLLCNIQALSGEILQITVSLYLGYANSWFIMASAFLCRFSVGRLWQFLCDPLLPLL